MHIRNITTKGGDSRLLPTIKMKRTNIILLVIGLILISSCNNNRRMSEQEYSEKAKYLWQTYVPKSGQAETVQGELIRGVEKLRHEAQRNGNINWDKGHEILAKYLETILINSGEFNEMQTKQINVDIIRLLDYDYPYTDDDIYDRLTNRIVDWYIANPDPVAHNYNSELHR